MLGSKSILSACLSKVLAAYLEVDRREIETSLLSKDGKLVLRNVRVKKLEIPVCSTKGGTRYMVISGTIKEFSVTWKWSSLSSLVQDSSLSIQGVRLKSSFLTKEDPPEENSTKEENLSKDNRVTSFFINELRRVKSGISMSLVESEIIRKPLENILDTFSIRVADFEYNILVTEAAETFSLGEKIQFGFSTIEFLSLGRKQEKQLDDSIVRPLFLHAGVGSLYLNLVGTGIRPLIEPFSYVATIRRVHGMRFLDMFSGYEIIGQQNETTKEADRHDKNYGLVLHFSPERLQTLQKMGELFSTGSQQLEADFDLDAFKTESMKIPRDTTRSSLIHFAGGLLFVFCMAVFIFFLIQIVAPVYAIIISLGIVATLRDLTKRLKVLRLVTACESRGKNAAVFRFPISFISVIAPNDTRMTLSDVSLLGRLDGSMLHFSASSFELDPSSSQTTPRLSMSGLRALVKNDTKLLNIESINELGIPGVLKVVKPVLMTVVRFEENSVKIKLNFVEADLLSIKENPSEIEHGGMNEVNQKSESSTDTVNAKEEREMVNAEIYREAEKLKYIAMMFEKIPVQSNRHNLRLYPNSFRGAEAVEYILESKLAKSRHEAVKLTRDLQVEFNLFQHVTREFNFRDEHDCLFRFTDVKKRRNWGNGDSPFSTRMSLDHNSIESPPLPFPTIVNIQEIVLNDGDSGAHVISLRNFELDAKSAKTVGAIDFTLFSGEIENKMIFLRGARVRALVHPDLPTELHKLQFSIEALHASPGYTTEDWYAMFGFSDKTSESSRQPEQDDTSQQTASDFLLPFAYIAPFNLHLSFSGIFIAARESTMSVNSFIGSEETTSNDLIKHFVNGILGRAPGILAKVRVLGVNVVESAGIATSMSVGFRFLPFGHYLGLGALAVYDGAAAAIDAGKAARDDPNDRWRPGDIARGIAHGAGQAARKGAEMRGKIHFDDNDKVDVDPLDFALGTTNATLTYVYGNKARFAGATVGGVVMVAAAAGTSVVLGPVGCIVLGVLSGALTENVVTKMEKSMEPTEDEPQSSSI